jgi:hypothetical protein
MSKSVDQRPKVEGQRPKKEGRRLKRAGRKKKKQKKKEKELNSSVTSCDKTRRKNILTMLLSLEWLGIKKVGFGLTGIAWNVGSWFLPDWNGLELRKSVLS